MVKQFRIAIIYICTGKYLAFWEGFYKSFEQNFLKESRIEYFVFTDASSLYGEEGNDRIHRICQENLGWPGNTLFRFQMFGTVKEQLQEYDFVFFLNSNMECVKPITEEEFLPCREELLVVQHPGYYRSSVYRFPYERKKRSKACILRGKGKHYVFGAINGGKADAYLKMAQELEKDIQADYEKGVIAKWHDESHLNYYVWKHENYKLLSPAYAYPEGWRLPFDEKIRVLDKSRRIELDQEKIKELEKRSVRKRIKRRLRTIWNRQREQ